MTWKSILVKWIVAAGLFFAGTGSYMWYEEHYGPGSGQTTLTPYEGPFRFQFIANQRLGYRLDAQVGVQESERPLDSSHIAFTVWAGFTLVTEAVDAYGSGTLGLTLDEAHVTGTFMGRALELHQTPDRTYLSVDGQIRADSSTGPFIPGIAPLDFFRAPIRMTVAPNGYTLHVEGSPELDGLYVLAPLPPNDEVITPESPTGNQWESEFRLPVLGLGAPIPAYAVNTFLGYEPLDGRHCAVIQQELTSFQDGGALVSPLSALGAPMSFEMPRIEMSGENMVYFDVDNGQLASVYMNLKLAVQLGQQFKPFTKLMGVYSELLREVEGGRPAQLEPRQEEESPTDLTITVVGPLTLRSAEIQSY